MMSRVIQITILLVALGLTAEAGSLEPSGAEPLRKELRLHVAAIVGPTVVTELTESGLSETDAIRVATRFSDDASKCVISRIVLALERSGRDPSEVFEVASLDDLDGFLKNENEMAAVIETCMIERLADAGLAVE